MWEDFVEVASGPWQVGIRFDRAATAATVRAALADVLIPEDPARPFAFGVRTRTGVGTTVYHGNTPLVRVATEAAMVESLAWLLAGLADAPRGAGSTTSLRVLLGGTGAVLLSAPRPFLLGAHAWRAAGLVELPVLDVRVAEDGAGVVLADPPSALMGRTRQWAGQTVPVVGIVVRGLLGERRETVIERLRPEFRGEAAQRLLERTRDAGRVRTSADRPRLLRHVLTLSA